MMQEHPDVTLDATGVSRDQQGPKSSCSVAFLLGHPSLPSQVSEVARQILERGSRRVKTPLNHPPKPTSDLTAAQYNYTRGPRMVGSGGGELLGT
eukprot:1159765-Pelagomonas_calceolata.AAC.1